MAMIQCPECGKEVSDRAASCPNCGCPFAEMRTDGTVKIKLRCGKPYQNCIGYGNVKCRIEDVKTGQMLFSGILDQMAVFQISKPTNIRLTFYGFFGPSLMQKNEFGINSFEVTVEAKHKYQLRISDKVAKGNAFLSGLTFGAKKTYLAATLNEVDTIDSDD